jgi:hypothetical protein
MIHPPRPPAIDTMTVHGGEFDHRAAKSARLGAFEQRLFLGCQICCRHKERSDNRHQAHDALLSSFSLAAIEQNRKADATVESGLGLTRRHWHTHKRPKNCEFSPLLRVFFRRQRRNFGKAVGGVGCEGAPFFHGLRDRCLARSRPGIRDTAAASSADAAV